LHGIKKIEKRKKEITMAPEAQKIDVLDRPVRYQQDDLFLHAKTMSLDEDIHTGKPVMHQLDVDALVERCLRLLKHSSEKDRNISRCGEFNDFNQVFIGISGTPGSGKSHIAEAVRDRIHEINPSCDVGKDEAVVIPMDGYHIPRCGLKQMADEGKVIASDQFDEDNPLGQVEEHQLSYEELLARRGAAFTYCPSQFIKDLKEAKKKGEGSFPTYSRSKHDPVENGVQITQHNKIIFVEGLYLLCTDDPDWKELDEIWDDKWYIDVSLEETKRRLLERHLKSWNQEETKQFGGDGPEAAYKKAETNDLKNAKCIKGHSMEHANIIISNEQVTDDIKNGPNKRRGSQILRDSSLYA